MARHRGVSWSEAGVRALTVGGDIIYRRLVMTRHDDRPLSLSRAQCEAFAAGLYHLAQSDGEVAAREAAIILSFCRDAGYPGLATEVTEVPFDPVEAYRVLASPWLRKLFLRAAVLIVRSDRIISLEEEEALAWIADAFGIPGGIGGVEAEVEDR